MKNVWWPMRGNFDHLHAEFEVVDLFGGFRYLDYAFWLPPLLLGMEVEGFGPHYRNASRRTFSDDHLRAAALQADGWKVARFSYDSVKDQPRLCQQILVNMIAKFSGEPRVSSYSDAERAVIQLAVRKQAPVTPVETGVLLGVHPNTARNLLVKLVEKGVFRPASGSERVRSYELCAEKPYLFLAM